MTPSVDACRTACHALSLIAAAHPPAVITALSKEVGFIFIGESRFFCFDLAKQTCFYLSVGFSKHLLGARQGDPLSPKLFMACVGVMFRKPELVKWGQCKRLNV